MSRVCGENHWAWKGGRTLKYDYVLIYKPDHPNCDRDKYVLEHRLVMEEYMGRYLRDDEVVHHKNGVRDDNRIENLQLMTASEHAQHHIDERHEEIEKRRCCFCGQKTRLYRKDKTGYISAIWMRTEDGWKCGTCWRREYMRRSRSGKRGR